MNLIFSGIAVALIFVKMAFPKYENYLSIAQIFFVILAIVVWRG